MLSQRALNRATLARQHLLAPSKLAPLAMIEQLAGMQAQVPKPPFIGLYTRLATFSRDDLHALITSKRAVRATMMRATIHLVSARDYIAWRPALASSLAAIGGGIIGDALAGIDIAKVIAFARTRLPATFAALRTDLAKKFPKANERLLAYAIRCHLPLVLVPEETRWSYAASADFADAAAYLGSPIAATADADDLVLRYLRAFGPASVRDAQNWSAVRNLAPVFERLRPGLVTFRDEKGRELFDLPDAPRPDEDTPAPIRLIPDFDNLMLGHDDRTRVIDDAHRKRMSSKNLIVQATYLVDGRIAGQWTVARDRKRATLTLVPFVPIAKATRAPLEEEALRILTFIEPDAPSHAIVVKK